MHVLVLLAALLFYRTYYSPTNNESSNTMSVRALMSPERETERAAARREGACTRHLLRLKHSRF